MSARIKSELSFSGSTSISQKEIKQNRLLSRSSSESNIFKDPSSNRAAPIKDFRSSGIAGETKTNETKKGAVFIALNHIYLRFYRIYKVIDLSIKKQNQKTQRLQNWKQVVKNWTQRISSSF
jgi:hypothetical protein